MWYGLRMSPRAGTDFVHSATELLQSTSRNIILTTGGVYLIWHLVATVTWPNRMGWNVWLVTPAVILACALAYWLLPKHLLVAQAVWQVGLAIAIALATYVFQQPEIAFFYALLPLMGIVTVGWPGGLLAGGLVVALVLWLPHNPAMPSLPTSYGLGIIASGAFTGLLGWAATRAFLTATQWSLFSYEQARKNMEEAREQQMELKQAQEDLIQANRELARLSDRLKAMHQVAEEACRMKEEFVANVSHELRTPLNMIIGFSEMIVQAPETYGEKIPAPVLADLAVIHRNAELLTALIDDVLDLSQVEAGQMALTKEHVRFREIIEAAAIAVRPLFESKELYLRTEVAEDLPFVFCDRTRIREVLLNLLSNAARFTERGGVQVRAWQKENDLLVAVADTGRGIALEDMSKLFQPFQQVDGSIRRRYGGTGLGLSISKRFIDMHGGKIWVESEEGVGTTFYFRLPLVSPMPIRGSSWQWLRPDWEHLRRTHPSTVSAVEVRPRFVVLDGVEAVGVASLEDALEELSRVPAQALLINSASVSNALEHINSSATLPTGTPAIICSIPSVNQVAIAPNTTSERLIKPVSREALLGALDQLDLDGGTALVVDDEPDALHLFGRMLASSGRRYRVLLARDGHEAMSILHECRPDVILLDLVMPNMDGFQLLERKAQNPALRDIPVVVISARDPAGQPIVSSALAVTQGGGLSVRQLLKSIEFVSQDLSVTGRVGDPVQIGTPPD
jgi:signal transduction histidine kinase/CheY-like chemotaxis protein